MNAPDDATADLEQACDEALSAARRRPLTDDEIAALRWACGIPERRPAASVNCGIQPYMPLT